MTKIKKIFAIQGFTSSGKDSITSRVSKELNIPILVSHTSRPPRQKEVDGVSYHFVDNDFFDSESNSFLEQRLYDTEYGVWKYGLHENELKDKPYSLFIVDRQGFEELQEKIGEDKLISIFIEVSEGTLRERHSLRGDCPKEFERRFKDDKERFNGYISDYIVYNDILENSINKVKRIIIEEMAEMEI